LGAARWREVGGFGGRWGGPLAGALREGPPRGEGGEQVEACGTRRGKVVRGWTEVDAPGGAYTG